MVIAAYEMTNKFPQQEKYGLMSQMQRAAVSIPANIAEGYGRVHRGDYVHHLSIARGSLAKLETHITIAVRLNYVSREIAVNIWNMTPEVGKMLSSIIVILQKKSKKLELKRMPTNSNQILNPKP